MRRALRIAGTLLILAGALTLAWTLLVWQWQDPFTARLYEVEAAPARVAVPEARRGVLGPDRDDVTCRRAPEHCA